MNKKIILMAMLAGIASTLFYLENLLPNPIPWIRLGVANIVILLTLKWWGVKEAMTVMFIKVMLGSLLTGKLMNPVFILSMSGGITSTLVMGFFMRYGRKIFTIIGVSIIGAIVHNTAQLIVAYLLYVRHMQLFSIIPFFLLTSMIAGMVIGFLAFLIHQKTVHFFSSYPTLRI